MLIALIASGELSDVSTQRTTEFSEQLISDMACGDTEALEQVYLLTKTAVYGFALSILKNRQNAEDVMQDVYIKLFHGAKTYRPGGKPMAWVLTIVRNTAYMKLRDKGEQTLPLVEEWNAEEHSDFSQDSLDRMVLHAALNQLSDEERQIVILYSVSGLKHREIAQLLNLPLSTTLSKYRRALSKLRKITEEGIE